MGGTVNLVHPTAPRQQERLPPKARDSSGRQSGESSDYQWYVPRALGESGTSAGWRRLRGAEGRAATGIAVLALALVVPGCGGGQRQDESEPSASFPVKVDRATFPERQRLAQTSNLELAIKNVGDREIPDLAVTIYTTQSPHGKTKGAPTSTGSGQGSFNVRLDDPSLSNPNRPVWILENEYPKLRPSGTSHAKLANAPSAGAVAAQTDTFQFGPLTPGETKDIVWRVTAVRKGTYPVRYQVAAGLYGKAKAVTASGGAPVKGAFDVTITAKPPQTCVKGAGRITTHCGP